MGSADRQAPRELRVHFDGKTVHRYVRADLAAELERAKIAEWLRKKFRTELGARLVEAGDHWNDTGDD